MKALKNILRKKVWLVVAVLVVILAASGSAYLVVQARQKAAATQQAAAAAYETSKVLRGDISHSASGSGSLTTTTSLDLSFPTSGFLAEVDVKPGDQVSAGQTLAVLDGIDRLKITLTTKELSLSSAQKALDDLKANTATLAEAQKTLAAAQSAYQDAKNNLHTKSDGRCVKTQTEAYAYAYLRNNDYVNIWESRIADQNTGWGTDYMLKQLASWKKQADLSFYNWKYCEGYTEQEILKSDAALKVAEANLNQAEAVYQKIEAASGADADAIALKEATVKNAEMELAIAKKNVAGATLLAPIDGTVISVAGNAGEAVDTSTFITLADLQHPAITVNIDQTDIQNLRVGCSADVVFDAMPKRTFTGTVTRIAPQLMSTIGYSSLQGTVEVKDYTSTSQRILPLGMKASVEVVCEQVKNVLKIPVETLHEDGDKVYVYILNSQGKPEKQVVETGLSDTAYIEITSGLEEGQKVITSDVAA